MYLKKNPMKSISNNVILHTHLGLGDMFICNGLIRKFIHESNYEKYYLVCKTKYFRTVKKMYLDEPKIMIIPIEGINEYEEVYHLDLEGDLLRIGHEHLNHDLNFDVSFYQQLGYTIADKFKWSKITRNPIIEDDCYEEETPDEDYIFVHDKSSVGVVDLDIETELPTVKPDNMNYDLVDYLKVIENAKEIHCLNSSFLNMIDLVFEKDNMYFHKGKNIHVPNINSNWIIIEYA